MTTVRILAAAGALAGPLALGAGGAGAQQIATLGDGDYGELCGNSCLGAEMLGAEVFGPIGEERADRTPEPRAIRLRRCPPVGLRDRD